LKVTTLHIVAELDLPFKVRRKPMKSTYNIMDIGEDGKIEIDIKIVGGNRMPLSEVVNQYNPEDRVTRIADMMSPD